MGSFDPYDWESLYFGAVSRSEANDMLNDQDDGSFFVRDSTTLMGEFVLSVKELKKVCHYLITKVLSDTGGQRYKIGENNFPDVASLLNFYKSHYLETTYLISIANRPPDEFVALFAFEGAEKADLPFAKGARLSVLRKEAGSSWWTARDEAGRVGSVPSTYLQPLDGRPDARGRLSVNGADAVPEGSASSSSAGSRPASDQSSGGRLSDPDSHNGNATLTPNRNSFDDRKLPAWAVCTRNRIPNAYDATQLRLTKGERILVEKRDMNGTWHGMMSEGGVEKSGTFPFTHIRFEDDAAAAVVAAAPNNNA